MRGPTNIVSLQPTPYDVCQHTTITRVLFMIIVSLHTAPHILYLSQSYIISTITSLTEARPYFMLPTIHVSFTSHV